MCVCVCGWESVCGKEGKSCERARIVLGLGLGLGLGLDPNLTLTPSHVNERISCRNRARKSAREGSGLSPHWRRNHKLL
jgi:hypothetical protein